MATPTILFDSALGSDTAASGAGPSSALSGANARNRGAAESKVGFHESTAPDLADVNTDGSHALWLSISGRRWSKITAKKDTAQSTTGSMMGGSAVVTSMGSTTGMSAGDPISVAGAGPSGGTLYSVILTVDSGTQVTLKDNASGSVSNQTVKCPKNVTCEDTFTASSATSWAIGGYRKDPSNAAQLPADLKAGWVVEFRYVTPGGTNVDYYTFTAVWNLTVAGDTTTGRITIKGSGSKRPILKGSSTSINVLDVQNALYKISGLAFDKCNDGIRYSTSSAADLLIDNCEFIESDGIASNPVRVSSTASGGRLHVKDCLFHKTSTTNACIDIGGSISVVLVEGCYFSASGTGVAVGVNNTVSPGALLVRFCVFETMSKAVALGASSTVGFRLIEHCTCWNIPNCINTTHVAQCRQLVLRNNLFVTASGTALDLPSGSSFAAAMVDYNLFVDCATPRSGTTPSGTSDTVGALGSEVDPIFVDPASDDFRPCANLHWNHQAYPVGFRAREVPTGYGPTRSRIEVGAVGREEPIRSFDIFARIRTVQNDGTNWAVQYDLIGGTGLAAAQVGLGSQVVGRTADATPAGKPDEELVRRTILQYLRNNALVGIENKEVAI